MAVRRVVTGDRNGRSSVINEAATLTHHVGQTGVDILWSCASSPRVPNDGSIPDWSSSFPSPGGVLVSTIVIPPNSSAGVESGNPDFHVTRPGFHRTDSVDISMIVEGVCILELDDGSECALACGDVVVVNGNMHAWHNRTPQPVRLMTTIIGAARS
jgi:hypothetical protein